MGILIDASVLIEHERGRLDLEARVAGREDQEVFLSVLTASELLHGVHRAKDRSVRARRAAFVEAILDEFPLLGVDLLTARTHARLWAELAERGEPIGAHDLWLAATCVGRGLTLATGNVREFGRVSGLVVEDWSRGQREA
ncbi:MAG: type II toxin-antitoxin system VapC family toxin [Gemmatimonadetes bacterium]|nr:type II toxin-antitoxin system VapC family toxin [Gemmatimonadota bacterium]